jgi:cadmium resistance protein CadD (predicted permease)
MAVAAGLAADAGVAALAFVGTNVDNTLIPMAMVAGAPAERAHRIAAGQLLSFWFIVVLAGAAAAALFEFSPAAVGLLGLVPLAIGVRGMVGWLGSRRSRRARSASGSHSGASKAERRAVGQSVISAALVTLGAGGDNLAAYIPLFRVGGVARVVVIVAVFVVGEVVVTALILAGGRHRRARSVMTRLGEASVPILLCAIGVLVMVEAGTFSLL